MFHKERRGEAAQRFLNELRAGRTAHLGYCPEMPDSTIQQFFLCCLFFPSVFLGFRVLPPPPLPGPTIFPSSATESRTTPAKHCIKFSKKIKHLSSVARHHKDRLVSSSAVTLVQIRIKMRSKTVWVHFTVSYAKSWSWSRPKSHMTFTCLLLSWS